MELFNKELCEVGHEVVRYVMRPDPQRAELIAYTRTVLADLNLMVKEDLDQLGKICSTEMVVEGQKSCHRIPSPGSTTTRLIEAANVRLPKALPQLGGYVGSRKSCNRVVDTFDLAATFRE